LLGKSIPLAEKYGSPKECGYLYSQLGLIFMYNAEFAKANNYLTRAFRILQHQHYNSSEMLYNYLYTCNNFCYQAKGDHAKIALNKAEDIIKKYPNSSAYPAFIYSKMLYHITKNEFSEALLYSDQGITMAGKENQKMLLQMFYFNKYDILSKQNRLGDAKQILLNILGDRLLINDASNKKTVYQQLSLICEKMSDYKEALNWSRRYSAISDSLGRSQMQLEINKLEAKFKTIEKEKQIAKNKLEINQKNQYLWILGVLSFLLLLVGLMVYFFYRDKRIWSEQQAINLKQRLKEKEQQEQINLTKAILQGEERERERIAKDLHDGLGGLLAGVKINFSSWSSDFLEGKQYHSFQKILNQLDVSVSELRRIARNLMPESLLNFGLEIAIRDLCEFYSRKGLTIDFQSFDIRQDLTFNLQINIYRIIQELLANAIKHSGADYILVQCSQSDNLFYITVEDNGKGIGSEDYVKLNSSGLKNLQNRISYLKGKIEIVSGKDEGTFVNIEINTNGE
jgi:signal transduction histidine kinase